MTFVLVAFSRSYLTTFVFGRPFTRDSNHREPGISLRIPAEKVTAIIHPRCHHDDMILMRHNRHLVDLPRDVLNIVFMELVDLHLQITFMTYISDKCSGWDMPHNRCSSLQGWRRERKLATVTLKLEVSLYHIRSHHVVCDNKPGDSELLSATIFSIFISLFQFKMWNFVSDVSISEYTDCLWKSSSGGAY